MTSSTRRGTALVGPFRVADPRYGLARLPLLPDADPGPDTPIAPVVAESMFLYSDLDADTSAEHADRRSVTTRAFGIRARRRTIPQGVAAGVTDVDFTDTAHFAIGTRHGARTYPNPVWIRHISDTILDSRDVLHALTFTTNNLTVRRGDRWEAEVPSDTTLTKPQRASIRATDAADAIMDTCRRAASWGQVAADLDQRWPGVPASVIDTALRQLIRGGFLLTDLTPIDTVTDPLGHVLDKLPDTEPVVKELSWLRAALAEADAHPPGHPTRLAALKTARSITDSLHQTWRPICADTAVAAHIGVPKDLADQAALAAEVLWRVAPGTDVLSDWHERFLHRYGARRAVPVLEACDPVTGLGYALDDDPDRTTGSAVLARLLTEALSSASTEVVLDDSTITGLDQRRSTDRPEPSVEVYATVVTARTGKLVLALTNLAAPAGSTRARFAGLLPDPPMDVSTEPEAMTAELAVRPMSHAVAALTGRADAAPWRIPIGTPPQPGDLLPEDLAVVSNGQRLSLWSTRHQRPVRAVHHNQLGHHLMPPLAGFLCRVSQHGTVALKPWTWEALAAATFTPRVRYRDVILTPARWRLPENLRQAAKDSTRWAAALHEWRTTTRPALPDTVVVADSDRQLPLDLGRADDRELLRRYVVRGLGAVTEPAGGPDATRAVVPGADGSHALEVVIPLVSTGEPASTAHPHPHPHPAPARTSGEGEYGPGSTWLSLAVDAPPSTQDAVLARIVNTAREARDLWHQWFWLRYHTPQRGPHLRIRFHGDPVALGGRLLPLVGRTCQALTAEGLSGDFGIETYRQEIERYGGPAAIEQVEDVFHHDAHLAAAILTATDDPDERLALVAVSAAEIARIVADADRAALVPYRLERSARHIQARVRPRARALGDADPQHPEEWEARRAALTEYRGLLAPARRIDCASSLIHMHANRILGDNHHERIARALAADLIARKTP